MAMSRRGERMRCDPYLTAYLNSAPSGAGTDKSVNGRVSTRPEVRYTGNGSVTLHLCSSSPHPLSAVVEEFVCLPSQRSGSGSGMVHVPEQESLLSLPFG